MDREHEAAAEAVEEARSFVALQDQAAGLHRLGGETSFLENADQHLPGTVRQAEREFLSRLFFQSAPGQILARLLSLGGEQQLAKCGRRQVVHFVKRLAEFGLVIVEFASLRQRNAAAFGQVLDRLPEGEAFDLHHELDGVAARTAAEALVELVS